MDFELMEAILRHPSGEPAYRNGRRHSHFLVTMRGLGVAATRAEMEDAFALAAERIF